MRKLVLAVISVVLGATAFLGACGAPTTHTTLVTSGDVFGCCHNAVLRLGVNETLWVDGNSNVIQNDGSGWSTSIGLNDIWSGGVLQATPEGAASGPVGAYQVTYFGGWALDNRWYQQNYAMDFTADVFGFTFKYHKGNCFNFTHFHVAGPNDVWADSPSIGCEQLSTFSAMSAPNLTAAQTAAISTIKSRLARMTLTGSGTVVKIGTEAVAHA